MSVLLLYTVVLPGRTLAQVQILNADGTTLTLRQCYQDINYEIKGVPAGGIFSGCGIFDSLGKTYWNPVRASFGYNVFPYACNLTYEVGGQQVNKSMLVWTPVMVNPKLKDIYACEGQFTLHARSLYAGAHIYSWTPIGFLDNPDEQETKGFVKKDQIFRVTLRDVTSNCMGKDSLMVIYVPFPKPEIYTISLDGQTLTTKKTYASYQWFLNGAEIPDATNNFHLARKIGSYQVVVQNEYDCIDTSETYVVESVTGINVLENSINGVDIYPNPATNQIRINSKQLINVSIRSIEGKLIKSIQNTNVIPVGELPHGTYFISWSDKSGNTLNVRRFLKL